MLIRIVTIVVLLCFGAVACSPADLVLLGARSGLDAAGVQRKTNFTPNPDSQITTTSPLVCTKDGEECKVISQFQANKLDLARSCDPSDDADCWYYEKPST